MKKLFTLFFLLVFVVWIWAISSPKSDLNVTIISQVSADNEDENDEIEEFESENENETEEGEEENIEEQEESENESDALEESNEVEFDYSENEDSQELDMNDEEIQEVFQEDTEEKEEIQEEDVQQESSEDQNEKDKIENNKEETREEELEKEEVQKEEIQEDLDGKEEEIEELEQEQNEIQEEIQEREEEIQELEEQENEIQEVLEEKEEEIEELEAEFDDREEEEEKFKEKNIESIEPKAIPKNNISNAIKEKLSEKYSTETQVETKETITETIKEEKQPKNTEVIQKIKEEPKVFVPKAKISDTEFYVDLGNRVFFDSYQSKISANTEIFWNFGDGKFVKNKKSVSHLYKKPGTYTVTLKLVHKGKQSTETAQVFVSKNTILLISDGTVSNEQLNEIKESAKKQNAYLKIISVENEENSFALEEKMTRALQAEKSLLQNADYFVALTAGTAGVNSYNRALAAESIDTENKQIVALSTGKEVSNIEAKSIENNLKDENKSVLFSTIEATDTIFASSPDAVKKALESKDISYEEAKKDEIVFIHPLNFLSHIVALLVSKEVAPNIIMLILMLPIAATVVVFFRQIIGLSSFGIFTPALLAVTFLATGLSYGLLMFFVILIAGWALRWAIQNVKLLSVPRISIVMIFVSFVMLLLLGAGAYFDKAFVYSIWAFPMLILAFVIEKYVTSHVEKWMKEAIILLLSTLLIAVVSYFVMNWLWLQTLLMAYPEIIFALVLINILLGKWTWMRLIEYMRFKVLINKLGK